MAEQEDITAEDFGTDAASRARRRGIRERLNASANRKLITGFLATLAGGIFWGFSGTCASYLFENYAVDTAWGSWSCASSARARSFSSSFSRPIARRLKQLLTTPRDLALLAVFAASGVFLNQYFYLLAVRAMNAGTATVLQCLQLIITNGLRLPTWRGAVPASASSRAWRWRSPAPICLRRRVTPPRSLSRPTGSPSVLSRRWGAACMSIIPTGLLARYGSSIVTGMGMLVSGLASSVIIRPWEQVPVFDARAGAPSPCLSLWDRSSRTSYICRA